MNYSTLAQGILGTRAEETWTSGSSEREPSYYSRLFFSPRRQLVTTRGTGISPAIARLGASRSFTRTAASAPDALPRLGARGFRTFRHWTRKRESNVVPRRVPLRVLERARTETR